tara:strand:- start:10 stop:4527 length:4518 start_codon:yes stop_codon:yes gene_type:complete
MSNLKTSLSPTSQTFIEMSDAINEGFKKGILKNDADAESYIIDMGFEPEDFLEANNEYIKLQAEGRDPRKVGIAEGIGKAVVKGTIDLGTELVDKAEKITPNFITNTAKKVADKVGDKTPDSVKDWIQGYSDPYYGEGKAQIIGEIGEDVSQGLGAVVALRKAIARPKAAVKDVKQIAKSADNIIKKVPRLFTKDKIKKAAKDTVVDSVALTLAFNPEEATLDNLSKAFPETFAPAKPFLDRIAVDPDDPVALQYLNTFAQELVTAGIFESAILGLKVLKDGASLFKKQKAIDDGTTAPVQVTKEEGPDTLENQANREKVTSNDVIEDVQEDYVQEIKVTKPVESLSEETITKQKYDVNKKSFIPDKIKELFYSTKGMTEDAYGLFLVKKAQPKVFQRQTALNVKNFNKALKEEYKVKDFESLPVDLKQKINRTLVLDEDIPEFISLKKQNVEQAIPEAKIKVEKEISDKNANRVKEGKKPIKVNKKVFNQKVKIEAEELGDSRTRDFFRNQQQELLSSFQPKTREAIKTIRNHIDDSSNYLKNSGTLGQRLSGVFGKRNKFYMQRSYNFFDSPEISRKLNKALKISNEILSGKKVSPKVIKEYQTEITKIENFKNYIADIVGTTDNRILAAVAKDFIGTLPDKDAIEGAINGIFNQFQKNYVGATPANVLKKRTLASKELQDLWSMETNPIARYQKTMRPLGEVVAQVKFLKSLRDDGLSKGYLVPGKKVPLGRKARKEGVSEPTVPLKEQADEISGLGDEFDIDEFADDIYDEVGSLQHLGKGRVGREITPQIGGLRLPRSIRSPLEGIFADTGFARGITHGLDSMRPGNDDLNNIWKGSISGFKLVGELGKTIFSPITQVVNFIGNANFAMALGAINPLGMVRTIRRLSTIARGQDYEDWFRNKAELGLIDQSIRGEQLKDYLELAGKSLAYKDADKTMLAKGLQAILYPIKATSKGLSKVYELSDTLWRLGIYDSLRSNARRTIQRHLTDMPTANNKSVEEVIDSFIAQRVRTRMPNWSYVPKVIRQLRGLPLGTFPSWAAEIIRTSKNQLIGITKDISGSSVNDLARAAGYKNAEDMLAKTGYDIKKPKVMFSLRAKGLFGLGATTALALGYDALSTQSQTSYNVTGPQMDALSRMTDYYSTAPKIIVKPVEYRTVRTPGRIAEKQIVYSYRDPSRVDIWQSYKNAVRQIIRAQKLGDRLSDAEYNTMMAKVAFDFFAPFIDIGIGIEGLTDLIKFGSADLVAEGSGKREAAEFWEKTLGPNAAFSPGFLTEVTVYARALESEKRQKELNNVINVWDWNGEEFVNRRKEEPKGTVKGRLRPSKYEATSFFVDGITKDSFYGLLGLRTKEFNVMDAVKFKLAPLYQAKNDAKNEFTKTVFKYKERTFDEDTFVQLYKDALEKSYQADKKLFYLTKDFRKLLMTEKEIAESVSKNLKTGNVKEQAITRLLKGKYDNNQLLLSTKSNEKLLERIGDLKVDMSPGSSLRTKLENVHKEYDNKKF